MDVDYYYSEYCQDITENTWYIAQVVVNDDRLEDKRELQQEYSQRGIKAYFTEKHYKQDYAYVSQI